MKKKCKIMAYPHSQTSTLNTDFNGYNIIYFRQSVYTAQRPTPTLTPLPQLDILSVSTSVSVNAPCNGFVIVFHPKPKGHG